MGKMGFIFFFFELVLATGTGLMWLMAYQGGAPWPVLVFLGMVVSFCLACAISIAWTELTD